MADLSLRLNKDTLVMSGSIDYGLAHFGIESKLDQIQANLFEQETLKEYYRPFIACGTQCIIANTNFCLKSVLAHYKLDSKMHDIASSALKIVNSLKAQHPIVQLTDTGLPLDPMSKNSLLENKDQYVYSARLFETLDKKPETSFDAYMLSGFNSLDKLKCALMGLRQVSDKPIIVDSILNSEGKISKNINLNDYLSVVSEFGATVCGVSISTKFQDVVKYIKDLSANTNLVVMADFFVEDDNSLYSDPDSMKHSSIVAYNSGARMFRASGISRPSHAAVLSVCAGQLDYENNK